MKKFNKQDYIIETYDEFLERKYMEETINMFHPNDRSKDNKPLTVGQRAAKTFANNKSKFEADKIKGVSDRQRKEDYYNSKAIKAKK